MPPVLTIAAIVLFRMARAEIAHPLADTDPAGDVHTASGLDTEEPRVDPRTAAPL